MLHYLCSHGHIHYPKLLAESSCYANVDDTIYLIGHNHSLCTDCGKYLAHSTYSSDYLFSSKSSFDKFHTTDDLSGLVLKGSLQVINLHLHGANYTNSHNVSFLGNIPITTILSDT